MNEFERVEARLRDALPAETTTTDAWESIRTRRDHRIRRRRKVQLASAVLIPLSLAGLAVLLRPAPRPAGIPWSVTGDSRVSQLRPGETFRASRETTLDAPQIGTITLAQGSRVRLLDSRKDRQRLALDEGKLSAFVVAPPRLFAVETPLGTAVDLGCAYTVETFEADVPGPAWKPSFLRRRWRSTIVRVTSGWVELADRENRPVLLPAGATCSIGTRDGQRNVGIPFFEDGPESLRYAELLLAKIPLSARFCTEYLAQTLPQVQRKKDSLTLYYLLTRIAPEYRKAVYERLAHLTPPPEGVTREAALRLDRTALDRWRESLKPIWNPPLSLEERQKLQEEFGYLLGGN